MLANHALETRAGGVPPVQPFGGTDELRRQAVLPRVRKQHAERDAGHRGRRLPLIEKFVAALYSEAQRFRAGHGREQANVLVLLVRNVAVYQV